MIFSPGDTIKAIKNDTEIEGRIKQITGVDSALLETPWGTFPVELNSATIIKSIDDELDDLLDDRDDWEDWDNEDDDGDDWDDWADDDDDDDDWL